MRSWQALYLGTQDRPIDCRSEHAVSNFAEGRRTIKTYVGEVNDRVTSCTTEDVQEGKWDDIDRVVVTVE